MMIMRQMAIRQLTAGLFVLGLVLVVQVLATSPAAAQDSIASLDIEASSNFDSAERRMVYTITNDGTLELANVTVFDDQDIEIDCVGNGPIIPFLGVGESVICIGTFDVDVRDYAEDNDIVTLYGESDSWVKVGGTRNLVSAECRQELVTAGAVVREVSRQAIDALVDVVPLRPCDQLIADLLGNAVRVVTLPGRADGWVPVNGTRNWVSPTCRARLVAAGASEREVPWSALEVLVDAAPFQRCDGLLANLFVPRIVTLPGRSDGWLEVGRTRNWVSASCRAKLVAAGAVVQPVSWSTVDRLIDAVPFQRCDALLALFSPDVRIVTLAGRNDGWVNVGSTRNWVNASCRTQLEAAGAVTREVAWPTLAAFSDAVPFQRCPELLQTLFNP